MEQLFSKRSLDIVLHPQGFIVVSLTEKSGNTIGFQLYNFYTKRIVQIRKSEYLKAKFGKIYKEIVEQMKDYLSCSVDINKRGYTNVMYPTGEMGIFNKNGLLVWSGDLSYHERPVRTLAIQNEFIWTAVPEENAVVRYSTTLQRVDFRIGGLQSSVFQIPMSVSIYDNYLFVCCRQGRNIKRVNLTDYTVKDYCSFDEPVLKYLKSKDKEIVVLLSGVYFL